MSSFGCRMSCFAVGFLACVGGLGEAAPPVEAAPGIAFHRAVPYPEGDPYWHYSELGVADLTGANQSPFLPSWPPISGGERMALSPDGQMIALAMGALRIVNTADGTVRTVRPNAGYDPAFAPDGRTIMLASWAGDSDLVTTDVYGREPTPIVAWPQRQTNGDYSASGSRIAFTSEATPAGDPLYPWGIYIADSDGTNAERVPIESTEITDIGSVALSASGTRIAFSARTDGAPDLYVVDTDGSDLERLTNTPGLTEWSSDWSADDSHIVYHEGNEERLEGPVKTVNPGGIGSSTLMNSDMVGGLSFRQPSTAIGPDDIAAHQFRPIVRFDSSEPWRPLEVERFLEEDFSDGQPGEHHEICSSVSETALCNSIDASDAPGASEAWTKLRDYRVGAYLSDESTWPVIKVHGEGDEVSNFQSPRLNEDGCAPSRGRTRL